MTPVESIVRAVDAARVEHADAGVQVRAMVGAGSRGHADELIALAKRAARLNRRRTRTLLLATRAES